MAIVEMELDPNASTYADLSELDAAAATKLSGIAEGADVNPADLAELDSAQDTKLNGIDEGAKVDQTGAEIKTAYEAEANAYTDTKDTKLGSAIITDPQGGEFTVVSIQRKSTGKLGAKYDETAV